MKVSEAIYRRRAYRSLLPVEITEELVRDLARHSQLAPSCFNHQPWRYVFVYRPDALRAVAAALSKTNAWARQASLIVAVFSERDMDCKIAGRDYYLFDTGMAVGFLILRATELGLVAHPIAGYSEETVKEALGIPQEMTVVTLINIGVHNPELSPLMTESQKQAELTRPERWPLAQFVHVNRFGTTLGPEP